MMLITGKDAAMILNVSMYRMYELMNSKGFPSVITSNKNGRKQYRVDGDKLQKWIDKGGIK